MLAYLHVLASVTIPIVMICGCGALLGHFRTVDTKLLADVSIYILAPALILSALADAHLSGRQVADIFAFTAVMTAVLWLLVAFLGRVMKLPDKQTRALTLTTLFSNSNNYGLPVLLLAFGRSGFAPGAVYVVGQVVLVNVLGMYLASRNQLNPRQAVVNLLRTPLIYATLAGVLLNVFGWRIPNGLSTAVTMLGNAYPVLVLLILGVTLGRITRVGFARPAVWYGVILRLVAVPLIAYGLLAALGVHGLLASVLLVEASMPAAINAVMLTEKFSGDSEMVSLIVAITTLLSFLYLPMLIVVG